MDVQEAKSRELRWGEIRRNQLSFTNNLVLTFTLAIIGYLSKDLKEQQPSVIKWGIAILFISVLAALAMSLSRLYDYKFTAKVTRLKRKKIEVQDTPEEKEIAKAKYDEEIKNLRHKYEKMGELSFAFLWCQLICFLLGSGLIIGYYLY